MTLSRETMIELMGFADGELDGEALERAQKLVANNEEARRAVDSMRRVDWGPWLEAETLARADAAGASSIVDAVMAKVQAERAPDERVVLVAAAQRAPRRRPVVAGAIGVVALAAGLAVYVHSTRSPSESESPLASADPSPRVDVAHSPVGQGPGSVSGVEVDEIDSPSHGVSVFEIPMGAAAAAGAGHPPSVVIWIEDEPGGAK